MNTFREVRDKYGVGTRGVPVQLKHLIEIGFELNTLTLKDAAYIMKNKVSYNEAEAILRQRRYDLDKRAPTVFPWEKDIIPVSEQKKNVADEMRDEMKSLIQDEIGDAEDLGIEL